MITQYKAADPLDPTSQAEYKLLAGGATRTWVGTEDAYNAEKNNIPNNTMICITDDNMDVDTDVYSTTETKTNKVWIDGKPIYRRILTVSANVEVGTTETDISGKLVETPADIMSWGIDNVIFLQKTGNFSEGLGIVLNVSTGIIIAVSLKSSSYWLGAGFHIMVEYTKTTD